MMSWVLVNHLRTYILGLPQQAATFSRLHCGADASSLYGIFFKPADSYSTWNWQQSEVFSFPLALDQGTVLIEYSKYTLSKKTSERIVIMLLPDSWVWRLVSSNDFNVDPGRRECSLHTNTYYVNDDPILAAQWPTWVDEIDLCNHWNLWVWRCRNSEFLCLLRLIR